MQSAQLRSGCTRLPTASDDRPVSLSLHMEMLTEGKAFVYHTLFRTITNSSYQRGTLDGQLWISMYEYYDGYILLLMQCGDYRMHALCVIMTKDIGLFTSFNNDIRI